MTGSYRWRKATDVGRKHATFELVDGDSVILDIGFSDARSFEVAFNASIAGPVIEWDSLAALINEGKHLAQRDL